MHGEARRLARLHDLVGARFRDGDRVVYLGNVTGHGDAVVAALDEVLDFRRRVTGRRGGFACDVVVLRGAQEEMWQKLLQLQFAANPDEVLRWMADAGSRRPCVAMAANCGRASPRPAPARER